jgi:hypothetical protein
LRHVEVSEADALAGHAIQIRRLDPLVAKAAQIAIAKIIGEDDDDVRRPLGSVGVGG